jgi:hypothetical protein
VRATPTIPGIEAAVLLASTQRQVPERKESSESARLFAVTGPARTLRASRADDGAASCTARSDAPYTKQDPRESRTDILVVRIDATLAERPAGERKGHVDDSRERLRSRRHQSEKCSRAYEPYCLHEFPHICHGHAIGQQRIRKRTPDVGRDEHRNPGDDAQKGRRS